MENKYTSYRLTLPESKDVVSKIRVLKNKLSEIEGLEAYHYKLTAVLYTIIIVIKDEKNTYLNNYVTDCLKKFGRNYNMLPLAEEDLLKLRRLK